MTKKKKKDRILFAPVWRKIKEKYLTALEKVPGPTPGPWTVEESPSGAYDIYSAEDGGDHRVCELVDGKENASLISAATDMLEALKNIEAAICYDMDTRFDDRMEYACIEYLDAVRAAIAKAEGRTE